MNRIEKMIQEMCPNGVEYEELNEIVKLSAGERITKAMMSDNQAYPVIGGGTLPTGFYDNFNREKCVTISRAGSAGYVNWQEEKFWATDVCFTAENIDKNYSIDIKYVYYFLKNSESDLKDHLYGGSMPKLDKYYLWKLRIPIPPLKIQEEIVKVLDKFDLLTQELTQELTYRNNQYIFYLNRIIKNVKGKKGKLIDLLIKPITDGPHTTPQFSNEGVPFISASSIYNGRVHLKKFQGLISKKVDKEYSKKYKPQKNDVFMVKSGSTTGKVAIVDFDDDFNIWSPLAAMRTKNKLDAKYLYYLLQTDNIQHQVRDKMSKGSQPNLSMRVLENFDIIIPNSTLEKEKVVNILDKFDELINDMNEGIPGEIELLNDQYEYYRNKILNFKELKCD